MRVEAYLFCGLSVFLFLGAIVYGVWAREPVGIVALILSGGFCGLIGSYFVFISRRIALRPEDRTDAEIADGAGELGFFSPHSYWPFEMGLAAMVMAIGTALWATWLMLIAGAALILAIGGLVFEYYLGQNNA